MRIGCLRGFPTEYLYIVELDILARCFFRNYFGFISFLSSIWANGGIRSTILCDVL